MMISNTVWNLNKNMERLAKSQAQMTTQSKIQTPSDDPVIATRAIKYRNYVATTEQYKKNVDDANSWQKITETALSDLGDVVKQVRDLTVQAANDTLTDEDRAQIRTGVQQLKEQAIQIMNTDYAGRYVFAGFATDQPPYETQTVTIGGTTMDKVTFKGLYANLGGPVSAALSDADIEAFCQANSAQMYQGGIKQSIKYNVGYGNQVTVNVEGQDVIGQQSGSNLFDTLDKLLLGLDGETAYKTADVDTTTAPATVTVSTGTFDLDDVLADIDNDLDRLQTARSSLGARMNYVDMTSSRLTSNETTYTELMSNNEDVDVAEASMEVSSAEYVYEASLTVGAKVISKSLVDFIR
jgi:flagellar hook-associated protein 3 FlgL